MNADEFQERFADVLAGETVYIPTEPEYIGEGATAADLDEYEQYVRGMTGVEPVRVASSSLSPARRESKGMIAMQEALWNQWCERQQ